MPRSSRGRSSSRCSAAICRELPPCSYVRATLLALLGVWSWKALALFALATALFLHVLNFFDAFHHTFEQYFVAADEPLRHERAGTAATSRRTPIPTSSHGDFPWLNLLALNFGYHNAHHHRASVPWYRLPALHRDLYGEQSPRRAAALGTAAHLASKSRTASVRPTITAPPRRAQARADTLSARMASHFSRWSERDAPLSRSRAAARWSRAQPAASATRSRGN